MTSTINRSSEVVANLKKAHSGKSDIAYAYAFGYAWAMLSENDRIKMLELAETKATEKEKN
jgi:hypothetical protein